MLDHYQREDFLLLPGKSIKKKNLCNIARAIFCFKMDKYLVLSKIDKGRLHKPTFKDRE